MNERKNGLDGKSTDPASERRQSILDSRDRRFKIIRDVIRDRKFSEIIHYLEDNDKRGLPSRTYHEEKQSEFIKDDNFYVQGRHDLGNVLNGTMGSIYTFLTENQLEKDDKEIITDCVKLFGNTDRYCVLLWGCEFPQELKRQFILEYVKKVALPSIKTLLDLKVDKKVPQAKFGILEARSVFSELIEEDPKKYAERFNLRDEIEGFISLNPLKDKNTFMPVEAVIDMASSNPEVYFDRGALYRMLRNLLRDAVVHSDTKVLKPVIRIDEDTDNRIAKILIFSAGKLSDDVLAKISHVPYTSQEEERKGRAPHGFGKVGARKLLERFLDAIGRKNDRDRLMEDHWTNTFYKGIPSVCWKAPIPVS